MRNTMARWALGTSTLIVLAACAGMPGSGGTSFFVTSTSPGKGGDLGGLEGADRQCQTLAAAAGIGSRKWRAYLSAQPVGGPGVNARERIGRGPWRNAQGVVIANDVDDLHGPGSKLNKQTALTEKGQMVNGRGDTPNQHDVLTGSQPNGTFIAGDVNSTCRNWTSSTDGKAMVGHHDRLGLDDSVPAKSWNSSHLTRGCSADEFKATGGAGLLYCFAAD